MPDRAKQLMLRLKEIHPEIVAHKLNLEVELKADQGYWIVKLEKGDHKLHTNLDVKDADACLDGVKCIYLGVQIGQFLKNFELVG